MRINFKNVRTKEVYGGDEESYYCCGVEAEGEGHVGQICLVSDSKGDSFLEWCKGTTAVGNGERISLEDLFDLLEKRNDK